MRRIAPLLTLGLVTLLAGCGTPGAPQPSHSAKIGPKPVSAKPDPLPAWTDKAAAKLALLDFVERTTVRTSADYIPTTERLAVFSTEFIHPDDPSLLSAPVRQAVEHLMANGYRVRFVSDVDPSLFRAIARSSGEIVPEDIIGTYPEATYAVRDGRPQIVVGRDRGRTAKPVVIERHLALRPVIAFGRSASDFQMLEYTTLASPRPSIAFLVGTPPPAGVVPATWIRVTPSADWASAEAK